MPHIQNVYAIFGCSCIISGSRPKSQHPILFHTPTTIRASHRERAPLCGRPPPSRAVSLAGADGCRLLLHAARGSAVRAAARRPSPPGTRMRTGAPTSASTSTWKRPRRAPVATSRRRGESLATAAYAECRTAGCSRRARDSPQLPRPGASKSLPHLEGEGLGCLHVPSADRDEQAVTEREELGAPLHRSCPGVCPGPCPGCHVLSRCVASKQHGPGGCPHPAARESSASLRRVGGAQLRPFGCE